MYLQDDWGHRHPYESGTTVELDNQIRLVAAAAGSQRRRHNVVERPIEIRRSVISPSIR